MPALAAQESTLRAGEYRFTGFLSRVPQLTAMTGTVSATPTYPAKTLAYTLSTGSAASITPGMTVRVLSSAGVPKGLLRVATGGTITSTSLPVNEFSRGTCDVVSGDLIQVCKEFRIWDRLVSNTAAFNKDSRIAYSDQGSNPPPYPNAGGPYVGFVDPVTLLATYSFDATSSLILDPDNTLATKTYSWDFGDGTPSTSTSGTPTVTFPVGFRWVKLTVTDSVNGKSSSKYIPVWAYQRSGDTAEAAYRAVQLENLSYSHDAGWSASFRLPASGQSDIADLPDGAMVVYWEEEQYAGVVGSYGSNVTGKSHVKFTGYLIRDTLTIDPDSEDVLFEAVSPLAMLERTPALPQLLVNKTSPAKWSELKTLTIRRALWYLAFWGTNIGDILDLVWDGLDLSYSRLAVQEVSSLAGQLRDIAASVGTEVTCNRMGRINFVRNPNFLNSAERTARTKTYDFTTADVMHAEIPREHWGNTKFVRGEAITTDSKPVFSNAPGNAPAPFGTASSTLSKQIVASQDSINDVTGFFFALENALYNGQFVPKGARITLPDGYDVFDPAYREFVTFTLPSTLSSRGISYDSTRRWTIEQVDLSYDPDTGTKDITVTLDHETTGAPGTTYVPPKENTTTITPIEIQFPGYWELPAPSGGLVPGIQTIAVVDSLRKLHITTNYEYPSASGGPTWVTIDLTTVTGWPGGGTQVIAFEVDAYSPRYLGTGTAVNGWLVTNTHVMRINDIFGTQSITNAFALRANNTRRSMRFERGQSGFGIVATWYGADGVWAAVTTDGGVTWTETQVTDKYLTVTLNQYIAGLYINPHVANTIYVAVYTTTGGQSGGGLAASSVYKSSDGGATWAPASPAVASGITLTPVIGIAFSDTLAGTIYYRKSPQAVPTTITLQRSSSSGDVNVSPVVSGRSYSMIIAPRSLAIPDSDANTLYLCGVDGASSPLFGVFVSHNKGLSWTTLVTPGSQVYKNAYALSVNSAILLGSSGAIAAVEGTTVDSRVGNLVSTGELIGLCGG